jgi:cytoskeleton-associated protein 5
VAKSLKKLLDDNNINVTIKAANALGLLAKGLRKDFNAQAKMVFPAIIDRLKDSKKQVVDALHQALDAFYSDSLSIPEVMEGTH